MARRVSKFSNRVQFQCSGALGEDHSAATTEIPNDALTILRNWEYLPGSSAPRCRGGISCVLDEGDIFAAPVLRLYVHYNGTNTYIIAVSGGKIYQCEYSTFIGVSPTFTEIGSLNDSTTRPSLLTWNGHLLIGDGGAAIKVWKSDTTWTTLSNGPASCTALLEVAGRVLANGSDKDGLYFSAPEFSGTDWDAGSASFTLKAGYGDAMSVVGFDYGPGGQDVIVSKIGDGGTKRLYRVVVGSIASDYQIPPPIAKTSAQNANAMEYAFDHFWCFTSEGLKTTSGTDSYGDLDTGSGKGQRINSALARNATLSCAEMFFADANNALVILLTNAKTIWVYYDHLISPGGLRLGGFVQWGFSGVIMTSVMELAGDIYFGSEDGRVYKYDRSLSTDETVDGSTSNFDCVLRSKDLEAMGRDIQNIEASASFVPLTAGAGVLEVIIDETKKTLKSFTIPSPTVPTGYQTTANGYTPTGYQTIANGYPPTGYADGTPTNQYCRTKPRGRRIAYQLRITSGGRVELNRISAVLTSH